MPLSINVGLSRKASKDYQSTGVSINVTAELDQSLLAKPDDLQAQVANLYAQAQSALEQQAQNMGAARQRDGHPPRGNGQHDRAGNGQATHRHTNGNGNGNGAKMTASQRHAILAIADRAGIDAEHEALGILGVALDHLSVRQASELIDHLKAVQTNGKGR